MVSEQERRLKIDAAVVRVMKQRKRLPFAELLPAVLEQLRAHFVPEAKLVRRSVEMLIEREHLERDAQEKDTILYVS